MLSRLDELAAELLPVAQRDQHLTGFRIADTADAKGAFRPELLEG